MSASGEVQPYRVLVVDDKQHARLAIREAIAEVVPDCRFYEAEGLDDAHKIIADEKEPFDLAVIDLKLQPGSGLDLLGPTKPFQPWVGQTRIIVYTAYAESDWESVRQAYESGASACISKLETDATKKLQKKASELLELRSIRENLLKRFEAQKAASQALQKHYEEWTQKYGGALVLVKDGKILSRHSNPYEVCQKLAKFSEAERPSIGILAVPLPKDKDASR